MRERERASSHALPLDSCLPPPLDCRRSRPGPGPPPLLFFLSPRAPPPPLRPVHFTIGIRRPRRRLAAGGPARQGSGPFLYDPFSAKREQARAGWGRAGLGAVAVSHAASERWPDRRCLCAALPAAHRRRTCPRPLPAHHPRPAQAAALSQAVQPGPVQWVCGEVAGVEVEVSNPAGVGMRVSARGRLRWACGLRCCSCPAPAAAACPPMGAGRPPAARADVGCLLVALAPAWPQIDKLVLEASFVGDASQPPRDYMTLTSSAQASGAALFVLGH